MPANKKYLIQNPWTKASKVIASILGALFCTLAVHFLLAMIWGIDGVMITSLYTIFILWVTLMLMVYWIKKAWVSWLILLAITLICSVLIYLLKKGLL